MMTTTTHHTLTGWARIAPHILAAFTAGVMPSAFAQTDFDTPFQGTINASDTINLIGPNGSVGGPVVNNGQLWFNNADLPTQNVSGTAVISGTGAVLSFQPVSLVFSNTSTFTGGIYLYDGTTSVSGAILGGSGGLGMDGAAGTLLSISGVMNNGVADIGSSAGSFGNVNVAGGAWTTSSSLTAGDSGSSTITISGGGRASVAGVSYFGYQPGSVGNLTITSGSFVPAGATFFGYNGGASNVNINGGRLVGGSDVIFGNSGPGVVSGTLASGTISAVGALTVGYQGVGSLAVSSGAVTSASGVIGYATSGTGNVTLTGGSWQVAGNLAVGQTTGGVGNMTINGGSVVSGKGYVGNLDGSTGRVTVTSGSWVMTTVDTLNGNFAVGNLASGTLTINGGLVSGMGGYIGNNNAANGRVVLSSGTLAVSQLLTIGNRAPGVLQMSGGSMSTGQVIIGGLTSLGVVGTGTATITGGTWNSTNSFTVGLNGNGTYTQSGGVVTAAGGYIGSDSLLTTTGTGSVTVTGGTLAYGGNLTVGNAGAGSTAVGTLTVATAGFVSVADTVFRASNGTININGGGTFSVGVGGTTGSLPINVLDNGLVIFNRSSDYSYANALSGTGGVTKQGASTLTVAGVNTYTGPTNVLTGTMNVTGQLGATSLTVAANAALSGTGSILGPVTIAANGTIQPGVNSVGTLSVGNFAMSAASSQALMQISGSSAGQYDVVAAQGSNSLAWGNGSVAISMDTTPSYSEGTTFNLFRSFTSYSGALTNISLNAVGTSYAGLTFSNLGGGIWQTGTNGSNQALQFNATSGDLIVVPEPTLLASGLGSFGLAVLLIARRRSRTEA